MGVEYLFVALRRFKSLYVCLLNGLYLLKLDSARCPRWLLGRSSIKNQTWMEGSQTPRLMTKCHYVVKHGKDNILAASTKGRQRAF